MYRGMRNKKLQLVTVSLHNRTNILEIKILVGLPISSILSRFFSQASIQLRPSTNIPDTLFYVTDGDCSARFHSVW